MIIKGKTEETRRERPVLVPLEPPRIPNEVTCGRTRRSAATSLRQTPETGRRSASVYETDSMSEII
jgi:hypothetical protein